ncbi:RagB/SusD family nutrient uptake outer membrane protein [Riemerella anatipestifer]|uniref:RagB/SusD family nutrient uptake outer membrane protein n=1 Tax=Riemerella anatipestifer TaxID=34085 RepID=UPI00129DA9AB|nr:RagB/SusD family nutrient uptake outer membrane protein [Riemerella anatipestifer]MRM97394.1 RagB/SusD family nutrient uptake outer membrane protein [Riemerella anatipestifer]
MKKILIVSLAIGAVLSTVSCERELNQFSNVNTFEKEAFKSFADYRAALDGVYDAMKGSGYYSGDTGNMNIIPDLTADNLILSPGGRNTNFRAWSHEFGSDEGQTTGLYSAAYFAISRANFVLENLNKGILSAMESKQIEAEARALRAMLHFDLARAYCKIPTQSSDAKASMGLPYVVSTETKTYERDLTVEQLYGKIIEDLEFAQDNILVSNDTATPFLRGRLNKAAVLGLLSRVYLYSGENDKALDRGEKSIALSPSVGSLSNFPSVWSSTSQDGTLLEILNSDAERVAVGVSYNQVLSNGQIRSEFVVYKSVYDLYTNTDVRKSTYFQVGPYAGDSYINVIKYNTRGSLPNVVNHKYLRTAEVYLNAAEAAYKINPGKALELLNTLRKQRYTDYVAGTETGTALWNAIQKERRLELLGESDRWFTLKRLGLGLTRPSQGAFADGSGTPATSLILTPDSFKWQWPIPKGAIDLNPKIKQNPNY